MAVKTNEMLGYMMVVLAGAQCRGRFDQLCEEVKQRGESTVDESYAMTYLMGLVDMAELAASVASGKEASECIDYITTKIDDLASGKYVDGKEPNAEEE